MLFDDLSFDQNLDLFMGQNINLNKDGFIYGNMFKDEYVPYKNYKVYSLNAKDEKEDLKLKIMEESFIVNDLNLYLDLHKNDNEIYREFKKHMNILKELMNKFDEKYNILTLNSNKNYYDWTNGLWPWEVDE